MDEFDGHFPVERQLQRLKHHSRSAAAEPADQPVIGIRQFGNLGRLMRKPPRYFGIQALHFQNERQEIQQFGRMSGMRGGESGNFRRVPGMALFQKLFDKFFERAVFRHGRNSVNSVSCF